jgi:penicillin-binding protein 2
MKFDLYKNRSLIIIIGVSIMFLLITVKLFSIQIINQSYKLSAQNNVVREIINYPERGWVYDRNGVLLVSSERSHDIMLTPSELNVDFDTIGFCNIMSISMSEFQIKLKKAKKYSQHKSSSFIESVSKKRFAAIQEKLHLFKGFYSQTNYVRSYETKYAGNIFGYVSEVTSHQLQNHPTYKKGDIIGGTGLEFKYEKYLRGERGVEKRVVDVFGRNQGKFKDGRFDKPAIAGSDIRLTIDIELQMYAEQLMVNKKGSIVAIEPNTGEILCLVSSPTYDPVLFIGNKRSKNYHALHIDPGKPLFDRSISATYPPGSIFKLINALIGLEEGVITPATLVQCSNGWNYKNILNIGCHEHASPLNLRQAIAQSCNAYFCSTFNKIIKNKPSSSLGLSNWVNHTKSFGLGKFLNNDLYSGQPGNVPNSTYYNQLYGEKRWGPSTCISLAIGQGALLTTPIQLANLGALISNKGYYITPHIVKLINDSTHNIDSLFFKKQYCTVQSKYFDPVIYGMQTAIEGDFGTARKGKIKDIIMCGKTGTVENSHGADHSVFMGFAPKINSEIAIAVYIENGGWGSDIAAPIGSLCIEKYLKKEITRTALEERIKDTNILY